MFFSNTAIIIKIENFQLINLSNLSFEEDNNFFSLFINKNDEYYTGEMHWSNSFKLGKLNIVHFIIVDNKVVLFTSSVQNFVPFKNIIKHISPDADVQIFKLPLPVPKRDIVFSEIQTIEIDEYFGLTVTLNVNNESILTKIYTNGIITFSMLMNSNIEEMLHILKIIINIVEEFHEV
ncbi:hypothetical protein [Priestia aryabhattai]